MNKAKNINCLKRLSKDHLKFKAEGANLGILAKPDDEEPEFWDAIIIGPDDTEWEHGFFKLKMAFPVDYPARPPEVKFITQMFHPNVYLNGQICLDLL